MYTLRVYVKPIYIYIYIFTKFTAIYSFFSLCFHVRVNEYRSTLIDVEFFYYQLTFSKKKKKRLFLGN